MQKITYKETTRKKLQAGVDALADVVVSTLGPSGHNVILDLEGGMPVATKDGVTVAKAIKLDDPEENAGAQMLKQASIQTADEAGDGTTTATLLARKMYDQGMNTGNKYYNTVDVKEGMEAAYGEIVDILRSKVSKPISSQKQLADIARISANGDKQVGELVSSALDQVGTDGAVTIEESKTGETYLDTVEGIQFSQGYKSPYFVTDNDTMTAVLEDVVILFADQRLNNVKDLINLLNAVVASNKSLLIVAEDIGGEVISTLVVNKLRAGLKVVAVKAPDFGDRRKAALEDMAVLTGGTVVSPDKGMRVDKFDTEWFGTAKKVTVSRDTTTIIGAEGSQEGIDKRIDEIKHQIDTAQSNYDKEQLQARLARFAGGVAVMYVGGHTELEMKEKKDRVDDALHATRAALEEGICPGGGRALLYAAKFAEKSAPSADNDFGFGRNLVLQACATPFAQILTNAGTEEPMVEATVFEARREEDPWTSYNPVEKKWGNMLNMGIIDPTKVVRLALKNAISVASTMLTSEAMVINVPDKKDQDEASLL